MIIDLDSLYIGMMVFIRGSALLVSLPIFSARKVPVLLRMGLAVLLACLVSGFVPRIGGIPVHLAGLVLAILHEIVVGLLMGLAVRMVFVTVEFAGHVIATETALMRASSLNPLSESSSTAVGTLLFYLAVVIFFATGIFHEVLRAFVRSFELLPVGSPLTGLRSVEPLVRDSSRIFFIGLQMSAPVIAVNFLVNFCFAVLGKVVPRMNVFLTSFAVRIFAGLSILLATAGLIAQFIYLRGERAPEMMLKFLAF